ncbi:MAG: M20/M25/M40 family metallo-hydrolase, partial [Bacteroidales bacterium]|nr:M20/M25/M40 family metallo-hydrolase [Bacteroidales bacterium]
MMDPKILTLFEEVLKIDSTSGRERALAEYLLDRLEAPSKEAFEVGDGTLNLLFKWGSAPKVVFCSHLDTVPPCIEPVFGRDKVAGRGACDAKGQWISMYAACKELERRGKDGFALLLVSGEEVGSVGAKAFSGTLKAPLLVIGEPTDNIPVSAAKGTKSYDLKFIGEPFHSGYPDKGRSAVEMFMDFLIGLEIEADFPVDRVLGETTWNVGMLRSDNPKNVLSPELTCQLYFRTTFASDALVQKWMERRRPGVEVKALGGDAPCEYYVPEGFKGKPVA